MANQPKVSEFDKMLIRLPPGMRERLTEVAKVAGRSVNAEVVARLEKSLEEDSDQEMMRQFIAEHEERLEQLEKTVKRLDRNIDIVADKVGIET